MCSSPSTGDYFQVKSITFQFPLHNLGSIIFLIRCNSLQEQVIIGLLDEVGNII